MRKPDGSALRYGQGNFRVAGFIATGDASAYQLRTEARSSCGPSVRCTVRPVPLGGFDGGFGIAGKSRARLGAVEQIKPLLGDQPERGMSRRRRAARHRHRIVAAEARRIDLRRAPRRPRGCLRCWNRQIAPSERNSSSARPCFRRGIDEIGDRVEAIDGQAGVAVDRPPIRSWRRRSRASAEPAASAARPRKSHQQGSEMTPTSVPAALPSYSAPVVL